MNKKKKKLIKKLIMKNKTNNPANPLNRKIVNDYIYKIKFNSNNPKLIDLVQGVSLKKYKETMDNKTTTIIIILESPHKDEFDVNGNGKEPLVNRKGFENNFVDAINNSNILNIQLQNNTEYNVILMNAIQYQCSLNETTLNFRDFVFLYYWCKKHRNFKRRLKRYIQKLNVCAIVNCCTQGEHYFNDDFEYKIRKGKKHKTELCDFKYLNKIGMKTTGNSLQNLVEQSILKVINKKNTSYSSGNHPSTWQPHAGKSNCKLIN